MDLVVNRNWKIVSSALKAAFVNGKMDGKLYRQQPKEFKVPEKVLVYRPLNAIEGLNQTSIAWRKVFQKILSTLKFRQADAEARVFILEDHIYGSHFGERR